MDFELIETIHNMFVGQLLQCCWCEELVQCHIQRSHQLQSYL